MTLTTVPRSATLIDMPSRPADDRRHSWYAAVRAHAALTEVMEQQLEASVGMSLGWYDVLVNLYLAPAHSLRMSELADSVLMSRSWLTRRIDQLERAGLVERCSADNDARGVRARLTREGTRAYLKLERVHSAVIDAHFLENATPAEAEVVRRVMNRVAASARRELGRPE